MHVTTMKEHDARTHKNNPLSTFISNLNKYPQDDIEHDGFGKKFFSSFDANYSLCKDDGAKHPRLRAKSLAPALK